MNCAKSLLEGQALIWGRDAESRIQSAQNRDTETKEREDLDKRKEEDCRGPISENMKPSFLFFFSLHFMKVN